MKKCGTLFDQKWRIKAGAVLHLKKFSDEKFFK